MGRHSDALGKCSFFTPYVTHSTLRLTSESKTEDGNLGLLADEDPICSWTQQQAISFISKLAERLS